MNLCTYLGHVVGNGGVCPEAAKVLTIDVFPQPQTKKQVRAFLGRILQEIHPQLHYHSSPLTDLTRRSSSPTYIPWSPDCQNAFEQLKNAPAVYLSYAAQISQNHFSSKLTLLTKVSVPSSARRMTMALSTPFVFSARNCCPAMKITPLWKRNDLQSKQQSRSSRCTYWVAGLQSKLTTTYWNGCRTRKRRMGD